MRCFCCKKETTSAIRTFMHPSRDRRQKAGFRDLCEECHTKVMEARGFTLTTLPGIDFPVWVHKEAN
jgi:hypothetical protein